MNDFTKEELQYVLDELKSTNVRQVHSWLIDKICPMIDNYCLPENVELIRTGQLLFHNKESSAAIVPKIASQIDLCENLDETKCFRIDWKIIYGKKFGH